MTQAAGIVDEWVSGYRDADELERRLLDAARRCITRWGIHKTSLDDIAREAGVGRATVYRAFPGGKERLVRTVLCHEAGRIFERCTAALQASGTLEDLVTAGLGEALTIIRDDELLRSVLTHEPELILPHFAFHQLDRYLDTTTELCRPHLARFLPADDIRPAAELLARISLTFGFRPPAWFDAHDPDAVRRLVRTYVVPALTPTRSHPR
ncbi:MAG TPA: helix-turn-helix domain-containing protein [Acidimicrobiales bacterium]|nr:helix-turn-helix domain-containing protein [Acidimicrobiales bacterium]